LKRPETTLESELERLAIEAQDRPLIRRQLLSFQTYLHSVICRCEEATQAQTAGVTTYVDLIRQLERRRHHEAEPVCLVTFNYETLLEDAMQRVVGKKFANLDAYVESDSWQVIKVHGSTSWWHRVDGVDWNLAPYASDEVIAESLATVSIDATILGPGDARTVTRESPHHYLPALALPTLGKGSFVCPEAHVDALGASLRRSNQVLIIGWRGADRHFVNFWREALAASESTRSTMNVLVVDRSKDEAAQIRAELERAGIRGVRGGEAPAGCSDFVTTGRLAEALGGLS
jgi:hypothetical protein